MKSPEQRYTELCKKYDINLKQHPGMCECFSKQMNEKLPKSEFTKFVDTMEDGVKHANNSFGPALSYQVSKAYGEAMIACPLIVNK